jgi:hypothetical protein
MSDSLEKVEKVIQFLVCPQKDFIGRIEKDEDRPNKLHVGYKAITKLRGAGNGPDPFVDTVAKLFDDSIPGTEKLSVILDEDWHPKHCDEFKTFEPHCVKGTKGAELPEELEQFRTHTRCDYIHANSINIASDSEEYQKTIKRACSPCVHPKSGDIRAGVFGVWTHVKVEYLLIALSTFPPKLSFENIGVCEPLCASPEKEDHDLAIKKFRYYGINVFEDHDQYCHEWLGLKY